ncbi:hypothetical protein BIV57_10250 [Mangrovactinospora gilvigrisea]|uniref:Uncharacterized protein n=1 Tax=Mangrovactinospora gilvigrisea TaxID=1428644 RepID=A0A1J7BVT1_9ACTN|nr:hypothetical protein [Mangrovactinospora gilvigrisea]OIV37577.1 hypothetical protein BIV57_10250 [Mangrovactinospora gilvigrisea]
MRVYIPMTMGGLAEAKAAGGFGDGIAAHAVTPALREWYVSDDLEELEYAALTRAAQAALGLIAEGGPAAPPRRVVVAVDVPEQAVSADPEAGLGAVSVRGPVPWAKAASVHVDETSAAADVTAAAGAWAAARDGDEDARFTVDGAEGHELLWYGLQEVDALLAP